MLATNEYRSRDMESPELFDDPLFVFELTVARRADELARREKAPVKSALELWCDAERAILAQPWMQEAGARLYVEASVVSG